MPTPHQGIGGSGIQIRRLQERALRLGVVEVVEQREALVEILLRLAARGAYGMRIAAHARQQLRARGGLRGCAGSAADGQDAGERQGRQTV